jgi:amino acid transporter
VAASSLLIDYVLTVSVSIAAGVAAITSALPGLHLDPVWLSLGFVVMLMLGNLRGIRESGSSFRCRPTSSSSASWECWRWVPSGISAARYRRRRPKTRAAAGTSMLPAFVLLTAFSNGCTALTGVEAVSNGVPAFRAPESKNAAQTLVAMAVMSITMFVGITLLAHAYGSYPTTRRRRLADRPGDLWRPRPGLLPGAGGTMAILVLAANTAYADFPRLSSILARDRFLPRQFMNQGDRLAFSNGIVILSVLASVLLVVFGGDTHALIPLYMIGVFVSFTLSQAGMVLHWRSLRGRGWRTSAAISGFGAAVTGIVLVIVAATKAHEGAWIILVMIPVLVGVFAITRRHYDHVASELTLRDWQPDAPGGHVVLVPIGGVQRAVVKALAICPHAVERRARGLRRDRSSRHRLAPRTVAGVGAGRRARGAHVALPIVDGAAARVHRGGAARRPGRLS